jgi:hypothetical protein
MLTNGLWKWHHWHCGVRLASSSDAAVTLLVEDASAKFLAVETALRAVGMLTSRYRQPGCRQMNSEGPHELSRTQPGV